MTRVRTPVVHEEPRAHISLKHSLDAVRIGSYVARVVALDGCTSFTTTESSRAYFRAIRRELGKGWSVRLSGEYVIGVRRDRFKRAPVVGALVRVTRVYAERAAWRDLYVHRRAYVHAATGRRYVIAAGHPPAGVEYGDDWKAGSNPQGVTASKAGMRRLGRWVVRVQRRRPHAVIAVGLDTNVDHHRKVWRQRFGSMLRLDSMWDRDRPHTSIGSHGDRLIDAVYANVPMSGSHISGVVPPRGVDHKAVIATLHIAEINHLKEK